MMKKEESLEYEQMKLLLYSYMNDRITPFNRLIRILESFPEKRLHWVESVVDIMNCQHKFILFNEDIMNEDWFRSFGDGLMIHHAFSNEPFTKDKFEHALVKTAKLVEIAAEFAPRGNRGHDVLINEIKISLKTQADRLIRSDRIWISKYMELGKGEWNDKPEQLQGLVGAFLSHLKESDKILILRCLKKAPNWKYELVEIPKQLLERASYGELVMMSDSKQMPKPGYCTVKNASGSVDFQLYFDGGSERKLQIKGLNINLCNIIAQWEFDPDVLGHN